MRAHNNQNLSTLMLLVALARIETREIKLRREEGLWKADRFKRMALFIEERGQLRMSGFFVQWGWKGSFREMVTPDIT